MNSAATVSSASLAIVPEADLHCHILPDWDDGPRTLDESLRMAARAAQAGLKTILVTPHVGRQVRGPEKPSRQIPGAVERLQEEIDAAGIAIKLVPGAELSLSAPELPERVAHHPWLSVGGQQEFILLESPFAMWPEFAEKMLFQLSLKGVTIIIAHPERYVNVQKDLALMEKAVAQGALLQITARSLLNHENRPTRKTAMTMLERGMVSIIASDLHTDAGIQVADAVDVVVETVGEEEARQILLENPRRILAGEFVPPGQVRPPVKTKGLWSRVFGR